jgi:serine O-acetyltransferase
MAHPLQSSDIGVSAAENPYPAFSESGAARRTDIDAIVAELRLSRDITHNIRHGGVARRLPSRTAVAEILNGLTTALFPTHYGQPDLGTDSVDAFVRGKLKTALAQLEEQMMLSLPLSMSGEAPAVAAATRIARDVAVEFASQLPKIRAAVVADLRAAHENDSGAPSMPEILLGYPGMIAIICYRIGRALHLLGVPLIARLVTLIAHSRTGIDIHSGAEIGERFSIDHGTGIVIGETAIVGNNVRLCQNVTLGANLHHPCDGPAVLRGVARHPVIEDNVFIFAGATLLGRITVGKGSVIGGNVWLTRSVPPGSNITQPQLTGFATVPGRAQV